MADQITTGMRQFLANQPDLKFLFFGGKGGVGKTTIAALLLLTALGVGLVSGQVPQVTPPQPTVPEIFTIQGQYVRVAYNNEGYAILGYKLANLSVGEPWMLLEVGMTVRDGVPTGASECSTPPGRKSSRRPCVRSPNGASHRFRCGG